MSDIEKRELDLLNESNTDFLNVDWSFFAVFSKIIENGGVCNVR